MFLPEGAHVLSSAISIDRRTGAGRVACRDSWRVRPGQQPFRDHDQVRSPVGTTQASTTTTTIAATTTTAAPTTTTTTAPAATTTTLPKLGVTGTGALAGHVTAIGDSVMLDAEPDLENDIHGIDVEAFVSFQFYEGIPLVQTLRSEGRLGAIIVIGLGTNGPFSDAQFDEMMSACAGGVRESCSSPRT